MNSRVMWTHISTATVTIISWRHEILRLVDFLVYYRGKGTFWWQAVLTWKLYNRQLNWDNMTATRPLTLNYNEHQKFRGDPGNNFRMRAFLGGFDMKLRCLIGQIVNMLVICVMVGIRGSVELKISFLALCWQSEVLETEALSTLLTQNVRTRGKLSLG